MTSSKKTKQTCAGLLPQFQKIRARNLDLARHLCSYQLEFDGWSQLQISVDNGRIVQTEHHGIEDSLI